MALILPRSIFVHIPKTGGCWVREALQRTGLPIKEARHRTHVTIAKPVFSHCCAHSWLSDVSDIDRNERISFAFVRHPLTLYRSYWAFAMRTGWEGHARLHSKCKSDTFHQFVENVLLHFPGWAGMHFQSIDIDGIQMIGRQERLIEDLITILTHAGEKFDPNILRNTPPQNVYGKLKEWQDRAQYTPELKRAVLESERETLERFGYGMQEGDIIESSNIHNMKIPAYVPLNYIEEASYKQVWMGKEHRRNFFDLCSSVLGNDIAGDVVELGCARGGTSALIAKTLQWHNSKKIFQVYDSFQGMPELSLEDGEDNRLKKGDIALSKEQFIRNFQTYAPECPLPQIHEGWFTETLPFFLPKKIAFAFLDSDFYDSILFSLMHIYPRLSPGAVVIIDDYRHPELPGVQKAVDEFFMDKPESIFFIAPDSEYVLDPEKPQCYFTKMGS